MRKLVYHVATSIDGFIARPDGGIEGFLGEGEHVADFLASLQSEYDTVLIGRATYEWGYRMGGVPGEPAYGPFGLVNYVFGRALDFPSNDAIHFVAGDAATTVAGLKENEGGTIWLCGGGALARTLHDAGLIDEVVVKLNPIWLGEGIPMFRGSSTIDMRLTSATTYANGVGLLRYALG